MLWLVASVWVMLHMRVKVHSPTSPGLLQSGTSRWVSWHHTYINSLTVIGHPSSCSAIYIAGWLFNGLIANDRWHRIYRWQQRSLSLGKGLMLTETVPQTDRGTDRCFQFLYINMTVVLLTYKWRRWRLHLRWWLIFTCCSWSLWQKWWLPLWWRLLTNMLYMLSRSLLRQLHWYCHRY